MMVVSMLPFISPFFLVHDEWLVVDERTSLTAPVMTMPRKSGLDVDVDLSS